MPSRRCHFTKKKKKLRVVLQGVQGKEPSCLPSCSLTANATDINTNISKLVRRASFFLFFSCFNIGEMAL